MNSAGVDGIQFISPSAWRQAEDGKARQINVQYKYTGR
jgi:hypothetical protein